MQLSDLIVELLKAQAASLQALSALIGEETLVELLEESPFETIPSRCIESHPHFFRAEGIKVDSDLESRTYLKIQAAVVDLGLSPPLEFHLWATPHYRALIESAVGIYREIPAELVDPLVTEIRQSAGAWVRTLTLRPDLAQRAELVFENPWLKFRTQVLQGAGRPRLSLKLA